MKRLLSIRIKRIPPDSENWYFLLALNPFSDKNKKGFFFEIFFNRWELTYI